MKTFALQKSGVDALLKLVSELGGEVKTGRVFGGLCVFLAGAELVMFLVLWCTWKGVRGLQKLLTRSLQC